MNDRTGAFPMDEWHEHDSMLLDVYQGFSIDWTMSTMNENMEQEFIYNICLIHRNTSLPLDTFTELEEFISVLSMYGEGRMPEGFEYRDYGMVIHNHGQILAVSFTYHVISYYEHEWSPEKKKHIEMDDYADDQKTAKLRVIELGRLDAFKLSARLKHVLSNLQKFKKKTKRYQSDLQDIYESLGCDSYI